MREQGHILLIYFKSHTTKKIKFPRKEKELFFNLIENY